MATVPIFLSLNEMFKWIILFSALALAACAALFSVTGIAHLFAGAIIQAGAMAITLEMGKLASVSYVYRYWNTTHKVLRSYMLGGAIVLSIITSAGIYSYLSAAYSTSAITYQTQQSQIDILNTQSKSFQSVVVQNNSRISQLQDARTHQETRLDSLVGKSGFVTQQRAVQSTETEIRRLQDANSQIAQKIDSLTALSLQRDAVSKTSSKLATFAYFAKALHIDLDTFVKWFILLIVLVFDPMAICLIVAYNSIQEKTQPAIKELPTETTPAQPTEPTDPTEPNDQIILSPEIDGKVTGYRDNVG